MMQIRAIEALAAALARTGPGLLLNVLATCIGTAIVIATGAGLRQFIYKSQRLYDADAILMSYTWGALCTLLLMYALGGLSIFNAPVLWLVMVAFNFVAHRRHGFSFSKPEARTITAVCVLAAGPLLISLTCPVPSAVDVLETYLAPVQRLLTYGVFDRIHSLPSALYPANRSTPLFTAFYAVVAKLFGLDAHEVLAATLLPSLLLMLLALYQLVKVLIGPSRWAPHIALLTWALSYSYFNVQSSRSTVWQLTFALVAIAKALQVAERPRDTRTLTDCAAATAATMLAHPFEGFFTATVVGVLVGIAWLRVGCPDSRNFFAAITLFISLCAPLLWTWLPDSTPAMAGGVALLLLVPIALRSFSTWSGADDAASDWRVNYVRWLPLIMILVTAFVRWNFYGTGERSFLLHQLARYPVPAGITILLAVMAVRHFNRAAYLGASATLITALTILVLPHLNLRTVEAASFRYEVPLKGMDFWLANIMTACAAAALAAGWMTTRHRALARVAIAVLLLWPVTRLLPLHPDRDHANSALLTIGIMQVKLAAQGYWGGWGDPRYILAQPDRDFVARMKELAVNGEIGKTERIDHIAEASNLRALPFAAFTGIGETLFLPRVDTLNVHTFGGRLYDIHNTSPKGRWMLVERSMLPYVKTDSATPILENDRVILYRREHSGNRL